MDITQNLEKKKTDRAKKMMLWFGIVSLLMAFAGWTSAYIVSSSRKDWLANFDLPSAFLYSTIVIVISSITYILAKKAIKEGRSRQCTLLLLTTLALGVIFIFLQFYGFSQMVDQGYYFTGPTSNITTSYIFIIAVAHIAHVIAGLVSLSVVLINQWRHKYSADNMLGLELGATFWHFLDLLWVYLILFFYFFN
ncbi:cytochrome c oxidase subunit 3 [Flavobacteriaceae bacterium F89]|uniref:Cytochrome c oxidase subunit 3 n=1 Tax=Cerina litoralis TaxID=2874477 RepID=A0AAE3EUP2_9FLAO|nr:cytochrome c oxidase subunit 3 [Cerina litoralis]MCG2461435.1 cytochrome c oxidase subunit 3 [Cerina litoralis]